MQIGAAARASGLSTKTVRYYADIGLVAPAGRGTNGYRDYDESDVRQLAFVRRARNFGFSLVALGVIMLTIGIWYHIRFMLGLRHRRHEMTQAGLIHAQSEYPISLTLITAVLLFLIGLTAVVGIGFGVGPLA